MKSLSRRDFLRTVGGASGLLLAQSLPAFARSNTFLWNPLAVPSADGLFGILEPQSPFTLTAQKADLQIVPWGSTGLWVYGVEANNRSYINPIFKINRDSLFSTVLANSLSEPTIIHWHGLHVDRANDGHPADQIAAAEEYPYEFQVKNRAGTYWYHTHAHQRTATQAYRGLASFFIVEDEEERHLAEQLDLQLGETDIPLVVQDKTFDASGNLVYNPGQMMWGTDGFLGNTVLTNLTCNPYLDVSTRLYRFRLLNGSNARIYRFAFTKNFGGLPFLIIGNDGGLLERPYQVAELYLAPGERVDVLLDLSTSIIGDTVWLKSLAFDAMDMGMMGRGMMGGGMGRFGSLPNGTPFNVLRLNVTSMTGYDRQVPDELSTIAPIEVSDAERRAFILSFALSGWVINGLSFDMDLVPVTVQRGSIEIWEITNPAATMGGGMMGGGMMGMMSMPHPMHLHGFQFQVLQRINSPYQIRRLAVDNKGLLATDKGFKDTVLVWPNETVRIAIDFSHDFEGTQRYLLHCHILEHEDNGMMMNFEVV